MAHNQQLLPADAQELVEISRTDDLRLIRSLLESKNQKLIFEHNAHLSPSQFQTAGTAMLFIALERNSDLVFGALRFLNVLHRLHPATQFLYDPSPVAQLRFGTVADQFAADFLMTLYACAESPFNGARPEALTFFAHWAREDSNAHRAFVRICTTWPWTNRNKYYFLSILADVHGLSRLLRQFPLDRQQFTRGLALSLQYRNLISPGQTLAITLARQEMPELFAQLAFTLRDGPRFEAMNCLQHWMRCVSGTERVFQLLELGSAELLSGAERFEYLRRNGNERLVLFRACFRKQFERVALVREIDAIVEARSLVESGGPDEVAVKLAQLDVIIANTIARPADIVANLELIVRFMRYTMHEECTALRQSILKLVPNLLYVLAPLMRRAELEAPVRAFFRTLRVKVFESGLAAGDEAYQPIVFAVRLYEVVVKTLHGSRQDRIIKRFSEDVNAKIRAFLSERDTWQLLSEETYSRLLELLSCEFDDVRDIACELLVRFFPANNIHARCVAASRDINIYQCGKAKLLARVAVAFETGSAQLADAMRSQAAATLRDYGGDPLWRMRQDGGHLFGALDAIGVCYSQAAPGTVSAAQLAADVRLAEDTGLIVLDYLQFGAECSDAAVDGSASFERMDENLTQLVRRSEYGVTAEECEAQKQWLLLSLWSALRAAGDLAASVAVHSLDGKQGRQSGAESALIARCYQLCSAILLRCRHKGAIEAAGLALGRIVRAVTAKCAPQSPAYVALADSVRQVFALVEKTDTTRRGAGLSILVHHLVRNERAAGSQRPLMDAVMRELLQQGAEWQRADVRTPEASANRDNRLAAVLHFLGTLVKDGELRNALSAYAAQIFRLAMAAIESEEWTVRNAALQLVGAFVPKLVGQTQFFNNELAWQPVYMVYGDMRRKQAALHAQLEEALRRCDGPSVQLVTLLELLARCEVLDVSGEEDAQLRELFYACLRMGAEKVRTLAARCLARFCQWYEVPAYVRAHSRALAMIRNGNFMHGVLRSLEFMLLKWESDSRCMPMLRLDEDRGDGVALEAEVRQTLLLRPPRVKSYFLRCYVFDVMRMVGCDRRQAALLDEDVEDVEEEVGRMRLEHGDRVSFEAWAEKVVKNGV